MDNTKLTCDGCVLKYSTNINDIMRECIHCKRAFKLGTTQYEINSDLYRVAKEVEMTFNDYQVLASRTINMELKASDQGKHALHGMVGEIGELHSIYQKRYQGHEFDEEHAKKELGDLMWFIAEYCTAHNWSMNEIAQMNIDKLKARYPEGFDESRSLNRAAGDI